MKLKSVLFVGAAGAYVAAGYAAHHLVAAISNDAELADWIVAALAVPLALLLSYALGRIEALDGRRRASGTSVG